jgi:hypothetical protein
VFITITSLFSILFFTIISPKTLDDALDSVFQYALNGLCENEELKVIPSPNEEYIAHLFVRDCGATTEPSYQLSLVKKGVELANVGGNIYVSYSIFEPVWESNKILIINYSSGSDRFLKKIKYKEINIKYVPY